MRPSDNKATGGGVNFGARGPRSGALVLLVVILIVHIAGRVAAVCHPYKVDSFTYSVAAYKFWHPGATATDLVSDKPPGQAILTGWWYRLAPGEPTRLTLIPVESAFLLGAYGAFFLTARRLHGSHAAWILSFFFVLAQNLYSTLDFTTDGYNLNENYLALPMLLAVFCHVTMVRPLRRGLAVGFAIGAAILIKQSAAGLLLALLLSEFALVGSVRRPGRSLPTCGMMLVGALIVGAPVVVFLWSRGWLLTHLDSLLYQTASHASRPPLTLPRWYNISPLAPALWLVILGAAMRWGNRQKTIDPGAPGSADCRRVGRRLAGFLFLWFTIEIGMLAVMRKPASHYYQQIVAPVLLLAGSGLTALRCHAGQAGMARRARVLRWAAGTTITVTVMSAMPLFSAAWSRAATLDYQYEVREFGARVAAPTPVNPIMEEPGKR